MARNTFQVGSVHPPQLLARTPCSLSLVHQTDFLQAVIISAEFI